ncbi:ATP phosphoribosyltransferase [Penicillium oxalicum]|uniref:ATP phosphoribosyltransferase n=1 Tax=Penicillium oxalicum TaxID=69781 RepID=UPI0020B74520|nr:ATP phosphoribosyltransferase [Penicillium oxalicum]KAI2791400.1 ATP phosphoribosyltransferase [Penicillium oxalicum]
MDLVNQKAVVCRAQEQVIPVIFLLLRLPLAIPFQHLSIVIAKHYAREYELVNGTRIKRDNKANAILHTQRVACNKPLLTSSREPAHCSIFLPAADIPTFVGEGRVDLGITGRDQVAEHDATLAPGEVSGVEEILDLGFGGCKLQVQVPEKGDITEAKQLVGKNVVTSFTALTEAFFAQLEGVEAGSKLSTKIKYVGGSVEAACALGVADGIVDLVESGETMKAAGLKAIDTVVTSTSVLVKSRGSSSDVLNLITSRIRGVIAAQKFVLCQYNIPRTELAVACQITPGKRAPTVTALEEEGWVAVSSMVEKKRVATVMDELIKVGATDILVLNIANSRTD